MFLAIKQTAQYLIIIENSYAVGHILFVSLFFSVLTRFLTLRMVSLTITTRCADRSITTMSGLLQLGYLPM